MKAITKGFGAKRVTPEYILERVQEDGIRKIVEHDPHVNWGGMDREELVKRRLAGVPKRVTLSLSSNAEYAMYAGKTMLDKYLLEQINTEKREKKFPKKK